MIAVDFKGSNRKIAEHQAEYNTLPAHVGGRFQGYGTVTTFWKPSFLEKLQIVFGGGVWLQMLTFCKPLQPLKMTIKKPEFLNG